MQSDLDLALSMLDAADAVTTRAWVPTGVTSTTKVDGSPVTEADRAAETAMLRRLKETRPGDGFLGEEIGEHPASTGRRWIADGIDGTRCFAAGDTTWGSMLALEVNGVILLGAISSPMQNMRWWATLGDGAYSGPSDRAAPTRLRVSESRVPAPVGLVCKPRFNELSLQVQTALERLTLGPTSDLPWSHQLRVADGQVDVCIWFAGDVWDHAAPSIIVEEAGGRFSDHAGGRRLDTRRAIYSNGCHHDEIVAALRMIDHPA